MQSNNAMLSNEQSYGILYHKGTHIRGRKLMTCELSENFVLRTFLRQ